MIEPTKSEIRAVIGQRADEYCATWFPEDPMAQPVSGAFNQAAFWASLSWFGYRKMYDKGAFSIVAFVLAQLAMVFLLVLIALVAPDFFAPGVIERWVVVIIPAIAWLMLAFFCGTYGNLWYQDHTYKQITNARARYAAGSETVSVLTKQGGTNWFAAIAFVLALVAVQRLLMVVLFLVIDALIVRA